MGMEQLVPFLAVAAGGAFGALMRFSVYRAVETDFPWATFIVNIVGCCLASFLMFRWGIDAKGPLKTLVFTGFFGAFTTMSTFSIDTVNLLTEKLFGQACANILMNSLLCVGGAAAGRWLALLRCPNVLAIDLSPLDHRFENRTQTPSQIGERVLDPGRNLVVRPPFQKALRLHGLQIG